MRISPFRAVIGGTMDKSSLLRRSAEILAGVIIAATAVVYTTVGIRTAGNTAVKPLTEGEPESLSISDKDDAVTGRTDDFRIASSDNALLSINDNEMSGLQEEDAQLVSCETPESDMQQDKEGMTVASDNSSDEAATAEKETTSPAPVYKYVNVNLLNVRKGPSSETEILTTLPKATKVQCFEGEGEWVRITADNNIEGFVFAEYLSDTAPPVYKYVVVNAVNLRKGPSSDTELLGTVPFGKKVQVFDKSNDYLRVLTNDGIEGYIYGEYLADETVLASRSSSGGQYYNVDLANKIIEYAKQFLGVKYVYGGSSPNGFDCSGFTQYVFKKFNIKLPRSTSEYASVGVKVSREDLKPGDILLFDVNNSYRLGHVGIYIGNDQFIHASSTKGKVVIAVLSKYGENLLGIRRVIK